MRKVLYAVGVLIIVLIGTILVGPYLVPTDKLKDRIADDAGKQIGREVTINGPVRWSIFPHLRLEAHDVSIANAPNGAAKNFATLATLAIDLEVLPLIGGDVILDRLALIDPVINLEIDAKGVPNWEIDQSGRPTGPAVPADKQPTPPPKQAAGNTSGFDGQIRLDDIRLENGKVSYTDRRTNQTRTVEGINAAVSLPSLDKPLAAEGSLIWNGKKIDLSLGVVNPRALMAGSESKLSTRLSADTVTAGFNGTAATAPALKLAGDVDLSVPSVRGLAAWAGQPLAPGTTMGPLAVKGKLAMAGAQVNFTGASLQLDNIKAGGDIAVDSAGARPAVKAKLAVERLDLDPYLQQTAPGAAPPPPAQPTPPPSATAPAKGNGDWSDAPIDFSGLKLVDLDLALSVDSLQAQKISVGKSAVTVLLKDGKLTANLGQMALYQGAGTGQVTADAAGAAPSLSLTFKLDHIAAQPFLKDAMGVDRLSGTGAFDVALASHGHSQREIVSGLGGKGAVTFTDGAIEGIDLAAMARNVSSAFLDAAAGAAGKTDFTSLGGTFTVTGGVVKNDDLDLKSPLIRVSGAGTVDLPRRQVDYRVTPKIVASAQGQGAAGNEAGLSVPIIVQGPLDKPSYKPDVAALLQQNPQQFLKALKGGATPLATGQQQPAKNPLDQLKGLIGK